MLRERGAVIHRNVAAIEIGTQSVSFELDNEARSLPAKQVIIAMGAQPDDSMLARLTAGGAKVHRIGDCREIGYIDGAILDARELVQSLG
jgi:2,4-dienoyl-CoA reductase (NADPH2)